MKKVPAPILASFSTVLFIFLFLFLYTKLIGPIPFSINSVTTTKTDLFTVSGEGEATAVPDTAEITLGVTKTASTVEQVRNEANSTINQIVKIVKDLGIEEKNIKTINYSLYPNYDYKSSRNTITGYSLNQTLKVKITPIDKANQIVDKVTAAGANVTGGIYFVLNDTDKAKLENQAREQAIKKAKEKAESLATLSGIKLGKIINVQEGSSTNYPQPLYEKSAAPVGGTSDSTNLQPGENTIHSSVTIYYETY